MKVPTLINPRTTPQATPQSYSQQRANPDAFGAGVAKAVEQFGVRVKLEEQKKEKFDINRDYIAETTWAQQDMERRQNEAPLGADGFAQNTFADYEVRHKQIVDNLRAKGYSEEALQEMDTKLAGLRGSVMQQSIRFQSGSYQTKVLGDMQKVGTDLTQIAAMNPYDMQGAIDTLNETVDAIPDLDATQRAALKEKNASAIRVAAAQGLAQQDPDTVVNALGVRPAAGSGRASSVSIDQGGAANALLNTIAAGESPGYNVINGGEQFTSYADHPRRHGKGGTSTAAGRYQFIKSTWDAAAKALNLPDFSPESQDKAAWWLAKRDYAANTGRSLEQDISGGNWRAVRQGLSTTWDAFRTMSDAKFASVMSQGAGPQEQGVIRPKDGKTGNPVLDSLTAQERMQVLGQAQTAINQRQTSMKAPLQVTLDNATSSYMNTGEYAGNVPSEQQFVAAFGPVEGQQKFGELLAAQQAGGFVKSMSTSTEAAIENQLAALRPTDTASPTYAVEQKQYEAARTAADRVIKMRKDDPANYVLTQFPQVREAMGDMSTPEMREQGYAAMAAAYAQIGMLPDNQKPLSDLVAQQAVSNFKTMSAENKIDTLTGWKKEMGSLYGQGLQQLAKEGLPVPAYLSGLVTESPEHKGVAANVLRGMDMIEQDKSLKPSYDQTNEVFRIAMGDAQRSLNPLVSQSINDAATALYVFRGGDPKNIDGSLLEGALRDVLGGSAENSDTGILDMRPGTFFNDVQEKTILPAGTTGDQFMKWKDGLTADTIIELSSTKMYPQYSNGQDASAEDIASEGVFVRVAPNQYIVKMNSDGLPLVTEDGAYYRMTITPDEVKDFNRVTIGEITIGEPE